MRALLITADGITEHDIDGSLKAIQTLIDCSTICGAGYPDRDHACYADDEGLFTVRHGTPVHHVQWYPEPLVGNLLVIGFDRNTGEDRPATLSVDQLHDQVITGTLL